MSILRSLKVCFIINSVFCPLFQVKWSVFFGYVAALGLLNAILWFLFFILFQVASVLSNVWLSVWTEDPLLNNNTMANTSQYANKRDLYLGVYGGLGVVQGKVKLVYIK